MHDELTAQDIEQMRAELKERKTTALPELIKAVQEARAFGDLSENFEYKAAKQEKNRNESRIRYLRRILRTATVVSAESAPDEVGLFDHVTVYFPDDNDTQIIQLVTTMRQDAMEGRISKESPLGAALFGHRVGDRLTVQVSDAVSYPIEIRAIEKGTDDASLDIRAY